MALSCWLLSSSWLGVHYMPTPTITLNSYNAALNHSDTLAVGATSWTAYDGDGVTVGSGTMLASALSITVMNSGTWVGGSTAQPGYYTIVTNSGTNGVVVGAVTICPANSNLPTVGGTYNPNAVTRNIHDVAAWLGCATDRDAYNYPASTAAQIISQAQIDPYLTAPQDSQRPHKLWIATNNQASNPTWAPTTTEWGNLASALAAGGYPGAVYEGPTNEPENGGWNISQVCTQFNAVQTAIKTADPTAKVIGWAAPSLDPGSATNWLPTFLANCNPDGFSLHMESSFQNTHNLVGLRQLIGGIDSIMVAAGKLNLPMWFTETGLHSGYNVLQPRHQARQALLLRFVMESYGHPKEQTYDFPILDHLGSGLPMYLVESQAGGYTGSMRSRGLALHVMSEALWGTPCTRTQRPAKLNFGPTGSPGDSLFAGLHYTGASRDVVVLATNGIESDTVTLTVSGYADGANITYWDGWGRSYTASVTAGKVTVPVNDLLTYVFLNAATTVSVSDTGQGVVSLFNQAINVADVSHNIVNTTSAQVSASVPTFDFSHNKQGVTGVGQPYIDTTIPASLTITPTKPTLVSGFALLCGPAWQQVGCSIVTATITAMVGGVQQTLWSYTCPSAQSFAIPSPSCSNNSDICTRTTWWTGPFGFTKSWAPVLATSVTLTVTAASYGGQPDLLASQQYENDPQQLLIGGFQVYSPWSRTAPSASAGPVQARLI